MSVVPHTPPSTFSLLPKLPHVHYPLTYPYQRCTLSCRMLMPVCSISYSLTVSGAATHRPTMPKPNPRHAHISNETPRIYPSNTDPTISHSKFYIYLQWTRAQVCVPDLVPRFVRVGDRAARRPLHLIPLHNTLSLSMYKLYNIYICYIHSRFTIPAHIYIHSLVIPMGNKKHTSSTCSNSFSVASYQTSKFPLSPLLTIKNISIYLSIYTYNIYTLWQSS